VHTVSESRNWVRENFGTFYLPSASSLLEIHLFSSGLVGEFTFAANALLYWPAILLLPSD